MRDINISTCDKRTRATVTQYNISWDRLVARLRKPVVDDITLADYLALSTDLQVERKDVGSYIGGTFRGNKRKRTDLIGRDILTFDLDTLNSAQELTAVVSKLNDLDITCCIHSTRKHTMDNPRIRVVMLLDRTVTGEEYEAIARIIAGDIGMDFFDPTTFQPARLMFFPSICSDSKYLFEELGSTPLDTAKTLKSVLNWKDYAKLPLHPSEAEKTLNRANKQQDPTEKDGVIGTFCRAYTIYDVIDELIPGVYAATGDPNRYTYTKGSTVGGAVVYDDGKFIFSNHATDPASGELLNAFDLVRVHKFGDLDAKCRADTKAENRPSYKAMMECAAKNERVRQRKTEEMFGKSKDAAGMSAGAKALELKKDGTPKATIDNVFIILSSDAELNNPIVYDEFSGKTIAAKPLPWNPEAPREWTDTDSAGLYHYIEAKYAITNRRSCDDAIVVAAQKAKFNPVADYLNSLDWDGTPRAATIFTDYLGAEDNNYTRTVAAKLLTAAVARAYEGGNKFDYMPILVGEQGIGKSTFLAMLSGEWFTDALSTFDGKTGAELIQGKWIVEVGELAAMSKHETAEIKQFITRQTDRYRAAYGRRAEDKKRRCVLVGTSNEDNFLRDVSGNRRFLPVQCGVAKPKLDIIHDLPRLRDQIWAEAVCYYREGLPLHLSKEMEQAAEAVRSKYLAVAPYAGVIEEFIRRPIPKDWDSWDIQRRKLYWASRDRSDVELTERGYISAIEIWVECLNGDIKKYARKDANDITLTLKQLCKSRTRLRLKPYGLQQVWRLDV